MFKLKPTEKRVFHVGSGTRRQHARVRRGRVRRGRGGREEEEGGRRERE
jgi:hypothetical protein